MLPPTAAGLGDPVLVSDRSAAVVGGGVAVGVPAAENDVLAAPVLLPGFGSVCAPDTVAVLVTVAPASVACGVTVIAIVAVPAGLMVPRLQVTTWPDVLHVPWLGWAETNV